MAKQTVVSKEKKPWAILPHKVGSDYYGNRTHPGHTIWPHGICVGGLSNGDAKLLTCAANAFESLDVAGRKALGKKGALAKLAKDHDELREALRLMTVSFRDLLNGWPEKELHELPSETLERAVKLVPEVNDN